MARIQVRFEVDELHLLIDLLRGQPLDGMDEDRQAQAGVLATYLAWRGANFFSAAGRVVRKRYRQPKAPCSGGGR